MKQATLFLAAIIFAAGCSKDPTPTPVVNPPASSLSAKINGAVFYANTFALSSAGNSLTVGGSTDIANRPTSVIFTVSKYAGLSTYSVDSLTSAAFTQLGASYPVTSGSITITTDNAVHTAGTFSLEAQNASATKVVTDGSFDIYK